VTASGYRRALLIAAVALIAIGVIWLVFGLHPLLGGILIGLALIEALIPTRRRRRGT